MKSFILEYNGSHDWCKNLWIKFLPEEGKMEFKQKAGVDYEALAQILPYYRANDRGTSTRTGFGKHLWDSHWGRQPVDVPIETQRKYYKGLLDLGWESAETMRCDGCDTKVCKAMCPVWCDTLVTCGQCRYEDPTADGIGPRAEDKTIS